MKMEEIPTITASVALVHQKKIGILPKKNADHLVWYTKTEDSPTTLEQALERFRSFFLSPTSQTRQLIDLFQPLLRG